MFAGLQIELHMQLGILNISMYLCGVHSQQMTLVPSNLLDRTPGKSDVKITRLCSISQLCRNILLWSYVVMLVCY